MTRNVLVVGTILSLVVVLFISTPLMSRTAAQSQTLPLKPLADVYEHAASAIIRSSKVYLPLIANGSSNQVPGSPTNSILLVAGDICRYDYGGVDQTGPCKATGDLVRSVLADRPDALIQTTGDNVNNNAIPASYDDEYQDVYGPNWGSFLNRTHVAMGNHDTIPPSGTAPYYAYFGSKAGPNGLGYYSYNIGDYWHVIVLNAECEVAGGCGPGTPQYSWLNQDLAANTRQCVLAAWHQPRFASGMFTDFEQYGPWWDLLYQYKADIVVNGHNHQYERFDLQNPSAEADPNGIREFVVGTGGAPGSAYSFDTNPLAPNEVIRNPEIAYGVLELVLNSNSYSWLFLPIPGYSLSDWGRTACH